MSYKNWLGSPGLNPISKRLLMLTNLSLNFRYAVFTLQGF